MPILNPTLRRPLIGAAQALFGASVAFAQTHDITAIQNLKCLTNDTIAVGDPFPASLRAACNGGDSAYAAADSAIEADNFRITYNPFGNLDAVAGDAVCSGSCQGGNYQAHPAPADNHKNVRASEGSGQFLAANTVILGEDVIVHLPKGFNGPLEHANGLARGQGSRDVIVMLHGGGGLGEAALSQLANLKSIQDLGRNGPVLLIPNAGNNLRMDSHQWAWDAWSTTCQTTDTVRMGAGAHVRFRAYPSQDSADFFDDGFDDACTSDLRRILRLAFDLKTGNKWIRRVILAGFSSGGHMTKTVLCTYPGAYDGYSIFEHGDLIGAHGQQLCGNLDQGATPYARFLSGRLDSLVGVRPEDLASAKRPFFHICSDQDDACSNDLGSVWRLKNGVADSQITDRALERQAMDHTRINDAAREILALKRVPDSADLGTLAYGQFEWKAAGLEMRAQTTLSATLPPSVGSLIAGRVDTRVCADTVAQGALRSYDTDLCAFEDASTGGGQNPDDKTLLPILADGRAGEAALAQEDIFAVRYVEKLNGGAYGYIEVHGGGHTVHGNVRADFGKTRDFDTFIELLKFMEYAHSTIPSSSRSPAKRPSLRPAVLPTFSGAVHFGNRNTLGREVKKQGRRSISH